MESKRKKILYCITKASWGGAQKYVFDLATALDPASFEVVVVLGQEGVLVEKLETKGIRVIKLRTLIRDISFFKDIVSFFKLLKIFYQEKPDIVHLNSSKMGLLGAIAGRILGIKKIIFTGHGWAFNEDRSKIQKKIIYWLHRLTISLADKTIAVSAETREQILCGGRDSGKIVVIRNGVGDIDFLDREIARAKLLEKIPQGEVQINLKDKIWLGTISELHKNKGLKYFIEAMHLLDLAVDDKEKLPIAIIIGEGERREKLQGRINRYGLQNNIFMIGRVANAEKYLKAFDIFTLTSITEALPYVLLEAGQAGLPVVASMVGGIPEIITNMESGLLVTPRAPEEIKKAITLLLENQGKRTIFGQNLQMKVREHFNPATMIRKTTELYNLS